MTKSEFYDFVCDKLDSFHKTLNACEWECTPRGMECLRYYNPCCYEGGRCGYLSDNTGCTVCSLPCKLYLCDIAQSKLQRIIVDRSHPLRNIAISFLDFRFKVMDCCNRIDIPLYARASKSDTFNKPHNEPELTKEWDWINQAVPLTESLDLTTYVTKTYCQPKQS